MLTQEIPDLLLFQHLQIIVSFLFDFQLLLRFLLLQPFVKVQVMNALIEILREQLQWLRSIVILLFANHMMLQVPRNNAIPFGLLLANNPNLLL